MAVDFSEADVFVALNYLERVDAERKPENPIIPATLQEMNEDADLQSMINNMMSMKEA